jgi:LDH2 family malate/lactate/ureidoglycolate dehydrogenase
VAGTLDSHAVCNKGDLFLVMKGGNTGATKMISAYLDEIRHCPPIASDIAVQVPGDRANKVRAETLARGLPVREDIWSQMNRLAS